MVRIIPSSFPDWVAVLRSDWLCDGESKKKGSPVVAESAAFDSTFEKTSATGKGNWGEERFRERSREIKSKRGSRETKRPEKCQWLAGEVWSRRHRHGVYHVKWSPIDLASESLLRECLKVP
jgi:hypothetical protein